VQASKWNNHTKSKKMPLTLWEWSTKYDSIASTNPEPIARRNQRTDSDECKTEHINTYTKTLCTISIQCSTTNKHNIHKTYEHNIHSTTSFSLHIQQAQLSHYWFHTPNNFCNETDILVLLLQVGLIFNRPAAQSIALKQSFYIVSVI